MAELPFVDTHVHYWDLKDENLHYPWLQPDWVHPVLGDIDGLKVLKYMAPQYVAETRFQNVTKAVHVQAALGILTLIYVAPLALALAHQGIAIAVLTVAVVHAQRLALAPRPQPRVARPDEIVVHQGRGVL